MRLGLGCLLLLAACGGLTPTEDGATFLDVVRPVSTTLVTGATLQLTATARDARGEPVEAVILWSAADDFLTVDEFSGLVTAVAAGTGGRVQARTGTGTATLYSDILTFTVTDPATQSPGSR